MTDSGSPLRSFRFLELIASSTRLLNEGDPGIDANTGASKGEDKEANVGFNV